MTSLAVKYRPTKLSDVVGQDAISQVLKGAFESNKVGQAYILSGIRGVGKTTTARILARSLQCAEGPTLNPCGKCASCLSIDNDSSLDMIEIDAASNNGVENIRDMMADAAYAPVASKRKVYILDEAHMLSTAAWNAMLKTLEEPPKHVVFIFATTEIRKVPATIMSRCQVLRLGRITPQGIAKRLMEISDAEGASLNEDAATMIARAGSGSMRDAISILEQAIAQSEGAEITVENVTKMLGRTGDEAVLIALGKALFDKPAEALSTWRNAYDQGSDPMVAMDSFVSHLHAALLSTMGIEPTDPDTTERMKTFISHIGKRMNSVKLLHLCDTALERRIRARDAEDVARQVEMTLMALSIAARDQ